MDDMMQSSALGEQLDEMRQQLAEQAQLRKSYEIQGKSLGYDANQLKLMSAQELMHTVEGRKMEQVMPQLMAQLAPAQQTQTQDARSQPQYARRMQDMDMIRNYFEGPKYWETKARIQLQDAQRRHLDQTIAGQTEQSANAARQVPFAADFSRYAPPGQLPFDIPPEQFDQFALPEGQTQPGLQQLMQSQARTGYQIPPGQMDDIMRAVTTSQDTSAENPIVLDKESLPGNAIIRRRRGNAFQIVPTSGSQIETATDEDGNPYNIIRNPKTGAITVLRPPTAAKVPESFHKAWDEVTSTIAAMQNKLADPDLKDADKTKASRLLESSRAEARQVVNRYHRTGSLTAEQRDEFLKDIEPGKPPAKKIRVQHPDGRTGSIPADQLPDALKAGFKPL